MELINIPAYSAVLEELKNKIRQARYKAALSVSRELVILYWHIGTTILKQQRKQGWGAQVVERLALDLAGSFPDMKGFSPRNLKYMRTFAEAYPDIQIVQQLVAQIPWGHNLKILDSVKSYREREWYAVETIKNGWSRNVLAHQIESDLYGRQKGIPKTTNFKQTLPAPQSDLARAEAALIYRCKPPVNEQYTKEFPFCETTINLEGQCISAVPEHLQRRGKTVCLEKEFTVFQTD